MGFVVCLIVAIVISCQTIVKEFMLYISTWGVNLLYAISRLTLDVSGCEAETLYQAKLELVSIHTPAWGVKKSPTVASWVRGFQSTHPHGV